VLLAIPVTPTSAFVNSWIFGKPLCHILPMILGITVYVSTLTYTAIAVHCYNSVNLLPLLPELTNSACIIVNLSIWVLSTGLTLPLGIFQKLSFDSESGGYICHEYWPKNTARQMFTIASFILQFILPSGIIIFCYMNVLKVLRTYTEARMQGLTNDAQQDEKDFEIYQHTNKMVIFLVVTFVCCWLPINIYIMVTEYSDNVMDWKYTYLMFFICHVIAMCSATYKPILYVWMKSNFQRELLILLPWLSTWKCFQSENTVLSLTHVPDETELTEAGANPCKGRE
jgi:hypothetical protein